MTAKGTEWSTWQDNMAGRIVEASAHKDEFYEMLMAFRQQANSKEIIKIGVWIPAGPPRIYVDVQHTGWKHYPCGYRASVAWDADTGELAGSPQPGGRIRAFARRGWGRFMDDLLGYEAPRWTDCGQREKTTSC